MGANFPGKKICQSCDIIEWLSKNIFSALTLLQRPLKLKFSVDMELLG